MKPMLRVLRKLLQEAIDKIDADDCTNDDEELADIIDKLSTINHGIPRISKTYACEKILHCSTRTFDTYIALGLINKGVKEPHFKELSWRMKDFDKETLDRIAKYRAKQGLQPKEI